MSAPVEIAGKAFDGKVVLITGAAGAIGTAAAVLFAKAGGKLVLADLNKEALDKAAAAVTEAGGEVIAIPCNVVEPSDVQNVVDKAVEKFGRIDHLFNNAGLQGECKMLPEYPLDDFKKLMDVNVVGIFNVMQIVARSMIKTGGGTMVNSASHAAVRGVPTMIAYCGSKSAVIGMTKSASKDLAPHNIRVNCISASSIGDCFMWDRQNELHAKSGSPYYDRDPKVVGERKVQMPPLKRLGTVEEVAKAAAWLLGNGSSYTTGFNLEISGGL